MPGHLFHPKVRHILALLVVAAGVRIVAQPPPVVWTPVASGVEHAHIVRAAPAEGSWNINVLRVDLSRMRLDVIRANDAAIGVETTSAIAARLNAIAAVNGGYFITSGEFRGDSTGTLQLDHVLWSEPDRGRASVGFVRGRSADGLIFGHAVWDAEMQVGRERRRVDGVNRARGPEDLVVFTPQFGPVALTDASGLEAVVRSDRVVQVHDNAGGTAVPADGLVVSARGESAAWLRRVARQGTRVRVTMALRSADASRKAPWSSAEDVVGAGPQLIRDGRIDITDEREKVLPAFRGETHPRTAIASLADGRALLLVADGRHPPERVGLALDDLARLLLELGAVDAINLDGGGSTTMVIKGSIVNVPSDAAGERPVSDAIVVRPRS
jgi:Phosphodiester glycosidase